MRIKELLFAGILCLLLLTPAYADQEMITVERAMEVYPDDKNDVVKVNAEFISDIDSENMESTNYTIKVENAGNETVKGTVRAHFSFMPEYINVYVDNSEAEIITESESYEHSVYLVRFALGPEEMKKIDIDYEILEMPNRRNIGLWSIRYNYNPPLGFQFESEDDNYVRSSVKYEGSVVFGYDMSDVRCNNCIYENNKATVDDESYFNIYWEKKRTPIRAGIAYIAMIFIIGFYLIKKRK
ncbi:MAG: hypothetical protein U9P44_02315 [archaeon]|nr:hypothetical protein [archaeon]